MRFKSPALFLSIVLLPCAALAEPETSGDSSPTVSSANLTNQNLQEIVVTAQKRTQDLQDVPIPVTVLNAQALVDGDHLQLRDYYEYVPGLNLVTGTRGEPQVSIRGIDNDYGNPTIGIVVDDLPQGSSIGNGGGFTQPDIDPSELQRVEVLRGPQGTLYGASSMGGLIKYVTVDPSTLGFAARIEAGLDGVSNGSDVGYVTRASVNVPLTDTFAIRASGYSREEPGYVDNVTSHQNDINRTTDYGDRFSAMWKPSDALSIRVSAMYQDNRRDGSSLIEPSLGGLNQALLPGTGWLDRRNGAYSAIVTAKFGNVSFTSLTGYNSTKFVDDIDVTPIYGSLAQSQFGVSGSGLPESLNNERFSQELRFEIPLGAKINWLLGGFFSHEKTAWYQITNAANGSTGQVVGILDNSTLPSTYKEYSFFTNVTLTVTEQFDVQLGAREAKDTQTYGQTDLGAFGLDGGNVATLHLNEHAFTYLVTPQYRFSTDLMAYARLASGYRPGGPNVPAPGVTLPSTYSPDKTKNYEIGVKGNALNRTLSFDASAYYIDWSGIQLTLFQDGFTYYANGGKAKSEGIELSLEERPANGLKIGGWVSFDNAVLTENLPSTSTAYGLAGDRLPLSARVSGHISVDQDVALFRGWTGSVGVAESYVGSRLQNFQPTPPRTEYPGYAKLDLRTGARYDAWTVSLFANNVLGKRGVIGGGLGAIYVNDFEYIQPRTIGFSVARTF